MASLFIVILCNFYKTTSDKFINHSKADMSIEIVLPALALRSVALRLRQVHGQAAASHTDPVLQLHFLDLID